MTSALIGHTGFVGSNLIKQTNFDDCYNSCNIQTIAGRHYDVAVCAGARAEKWKINKNPDEDLKNIHLLMDSLRKVRIDYLILISTIDVYPDVSEVTEDTFIDLEKCHPYGRHRLLLEQFVTREFPEHLIIRLPGLFGRNIKKNIVYDFLHNNQLNDIHADSVYQFYWLDDLWKDVTKAKDNHLQLINFGTEPTSVSEVAREAFGFEFKNRPAGKIAAHYDMRTNHSALWNRSDGYLYGKESILGAMKHFVLQERSRV